MNVSIFGTGYVGLVTGACLAEMGNRVLCVDVDAAKVAALEGGRVPIYEPGLEPLVARNRAAGRLAFTTDAAAGAAHGVVQLIAVGTPPDENGAADLAHVFAAARAIGRHMDGYRAIAVKSTVPVGTCDRVREAIAEELARRGAAHEFSVVSNPEFLKEGGAVEDFMRPDRILVGSEDERATALLRELYAPFQRNRERLMVTSVRSAELAKYAANAMLATRISFMNELANLAEALGADIEEIRRAIGADPRIGTHFLYAGAGFGGSCFPKDLRALLATAQQAGCALRVVAAAAQANEAQKRVLAAKIRRRFGARLEGLRFALWGLAFKPGTDDMREAPSRALVADLLEAGAAVRAYDPAAGAEARRLFAATPGVEIVEAALEALEGCDALVVVTEWQEFRSPDFAELRRRLKTPVIFDGRNLYDPQALRRSGFEYHGIGRAA
ncbi:MAG: UDP-glucose/GDP-mannose dehydrogenase family protein [Burkholderiales bacterium]|nr:UDP-glucose/GDP-mannose dehydrogenase family protein [Burkholderiales bacterium]